MMAEQQCTCTESFGQLVWDNDCPIHEQCDATMQGVGIRCILAAHDKGLHR